MTNLLVKKESLEDIADAIRAKNGSTTEYKPSEMAGAISAIPSGGITPTGTKSITTNGDHDVTNFATAHVDVPTGITPSGSQTFTANGTYDVTSLAEAVVNVASSGGGVNLEVVDVTLDKTYSTAANFYIPIEDASYDNYVVTFSLIETGQYVDGELVMDSVPTVPTNGDVNITGVYALVTAYEEFNGVYNNTAQTVDVGGGCRSVLRTALNSAASGPLVVDQANSRIKVPGNRYWGQLGSNSFYKYRFKVLGWND